MPTGFMRGANTVTGMSDPSRGVTPEHGAEMQENIRKLEARLAVLEGRSLEVTPAPEPYSPPMFVGINGINVNQTPRRVTISRARDDGVAEEATSPSLPFRIYQAVGATMTIPMGMAMGGYAPDPAVPATLNWSLEFTVTSSKLSNYSETSPAPPDLPELINPIGTSAMDDEGATPEPNTELYNGNAGKVVAGEPAPIVQTYYRIPIIRAGVRVCNGGAYRENIFCAGSRGPIVELIGI